MTHMGPSRTRRARSDGGLRVPGMRTVDDVPALARLVERRGFRLVEGRYDRAAFGNTWIVLAGPGIDLRLFRDRGRFRLDVRAHPGDEASGHHGDAVPGPAEWHAAETVLAFLRVPFADRETGTLAACVDAAFGHVAGLLADADSRARLARFARGGGGGPPVDPATPAGHADAADVQRVVRRDFAAQDLPQVTAMLSRYTDREPHRVHLAMLKTARGRLHVLEEMCETARIDYRDVLVWAECRRESRFWTGGAEAQATDAAPRRAEAEHQDRVEYIEWLLRP